MCRDRGDHKQDQADCGRRAQKGRHPQDAWKDQPGGGEDFDTPDTLDLSIGEFLDVGQLRL